MRAYRIFNPIYKYRAKKVESTIGNQQMTVENFVMTTAIKDSTLITQGSFKFTSVMEVYGETYITSTLTLLNTFFTELNTIANNVGTTCTCKIDDGEEFKKIKFENDSSKILWCLIQPIN